MLISCFPGIGHVGPTLPLACAARAAGHEVRYAVAPENAGWLVAQGFDARATGLSHEEMLRRWGEFAPRPEDDPAVRRPDISLAKRVLQWEPKIALDEGLRRTAEWFAKELKS